VSKNNTKPLSVAGVLIRKNDKYLLVQEKKAIAHGLWNWPAGHIDEGATVEETAIREAKEETGYDVELGRKLGVFHKEGDRAQKHIFEAKIVGGELKFPKGEILDARWFTLEEIGAMKEKLRNVQLLESIQILLSR